MHGWPAVRRPSAGSASPLEAADHGWIRALRDPVLAPVLAAIHDSPERKWTVGAPSSAPSAARRGPGAERERPPAPGAEPGAGGRPADYLVTASSASAMPSP